MSIHLDINCGVPARRRRKVFRFSLMSVLATFVLVAMCAATIRGLGPRIVRNATRSQSPLWGLPADAAGVSCYAPALFGPRMAYEFTTSETSFRAWAESRGWPLVPIAEPQQVLRYSALAKNDDKPYELLVSDGWFYEWHHEDCGIYVAYDGTTGKAYY